MVTLAFGEMAFALFHALILMGDRYIAYTLPQILLPGASVNYKPIEVGLGQAALYLMLVVGLSFYVRKQITQKVWRLVHYLSFVLYLLVLAHGILSGTDAATPWAAAIYWVTGGSLIFLVVYRILLLFPLFQGQASKNARPPARSQGQVVD